MKLIKIFQTVWGSGGMMYDHVYEDDYDDEEEEEDDDDEDEDEHVADDDVS